MLVLKVAVDGLGAADDLSLRTVFRKVLGKQARISVWVIAANDDDTIKVEQGAELEGVCELLFGFNLVASGTYTH